MAKGDPLGVKVCPGCGTRVIVTETTRETGYIGCTDCKFVGYLNKKWQIEALEPLEEEKHDGEEREEPEEGQPAEVPGAGDDGEEDDGGDWLSDL